MTATTISPKFQVVIPREIRKQLLIKSGQRVTMVVKNGVIFIVPQVPVSRLRGTLRDVPAEGFREKKDRL